jgi:hypothetical protein
VFDHQEIEKKAQNIAQAACCAFLANQPEVGKTLLAKAWSADPINDVVQRCKGYILAKEAQSQGDLSLASQALDHFTEAKDLNPTDQNVRNFFLIKKMIWLLNQEIMNYQQTQLQNRLLNTQRQWESLGKYLKDVNRTAMEHIPTNFVCPLTLVR